MILGMHPVIHSAKNRSLKYRNLTRTSPHPPSHCPPPFIQRTAYNLHGALPQTDATLSFLLLTPVHNTLQHTVQSSTSIPPPATFSIQRKSKLLPSPIGQCPGEGSRTVTPWLSLPQLFIAILSVTVTEICTTAFYSAVSVKLLR